MIVVVQRVSTASVTIENTVKGKIEQGLLLLLGIASADGQEDIDWLTQKIANMRIFHDGNSVKNVDGQILLISQFTLHASTKKGNRPSYSHAAKPEIAMPLYKAFIKSLEARLEKPIQTGSFGANMKVSLINDGPVTIILDSKNRK